MVTPGMRDTTRTLRDLYWLSLGCTIWFGTHGHHGWAWVTFALSWVLILVWHVLRFRQSRADG